MYVCTYVCIVYICVLVLVYVHTHICMYVSTYIHLCLATYIFTVCVFVLCFCLFRGSKDDEIACLRAEGDKLAKQQLQNSETIKKLRKKEQENSKLISNLKLVCLGTLNSLCV